MFCSECGSPIAHDPDAAPEIIAIKAGTLDIEIKKNLKPVRALRRRAIGLNMLTTYVPGRIRKSGPLASFLSARSIWPSLSSTCPSRWDEKTNL